MHYIDTFGQDRVLFGTNCPVLDFRRTRDQIEAPGLRPESLRKLLRDDVIRICGLDKT